MPAALVNDQLRDYWGKAAIRAWAERDIIGERLTIAVTEVVKHYDNLIVTADIDGNFDRRGLPDPLVLAFYFTVHSDLIIQLIILRHRQRYLTTADTLRLLQSISDRIRARVTINNLL